MSETLTRDTPETGEWLTMDEIEKRYDGEWVVLIDVEDDENMNIVGGRIFAHGTDRDAVYAVGPLPQPVNAASLYIGESDPNTVIML